VWGSVAACGGAPVSLPAKAFGDAYGRYSATRGKIPWVSAGHSVDVRSENPHDRGAIRLIHEAAFGGPDEADLVGRLHDEGVVLASLVADREKQIVGHILFTRMSIEMDGGPVSAVALAPLAVLPEQQRRGIGGLLIRHGLDRLRGAGERIVIVVGHPDYYPRFGFSTDHARSLVSPFAVEAFMALELKPGALDGVRGAVRYPEAFRL
jgi:putative acetyltransferase